MTNKQISITAAIILVVGAGAFYGGYKTAQSKNPAKSFAGGQMLMGGRQTGNNRFGSGNNFINGSVIAKDNTTLTIQMRQMPGMASSSGSGSKIVILSPNTQIFKSVQGTPDDVTIGENVTITGTENSSGALTAQSIQIRQNLPDNGNTAPKTPNQ